MAAAFLIIYCLLSKPQASRPEILLEPCVTVALKVVWVAPENRPR